MSPDIQGSYTIRIDDKERSASSFDGMMIVLEEIWIPDARGVEEAMRLYFIDQWKGCPQIFETLETSSGRHLIITRNS